MVAEDDRHGFGDQVGPAGIAHPFVDDEHQRTYSTPSPICTRSARPRRSPIPSFRESAVVPLRTPTLRQNPPPACVARVNTLFPTSLPADPCDARRATPGLARHPLPAPPPSSRFRLADAAFQPVSPGRRRFPTNRWPVVRLTRMAEGLNTESAEGRRGAGEGTGRQALQRIRGNSGFGIVVGGRAPSWGCGDPAFCSAGCTRPSRSHPTGFEPVSPVRRRFPTGGA